MKIILLLVTLKFFDLFVNTSEHCSSFNSIERKILNYVKEDYCKRNIQTPDSTLFFKANRVVQFHLTSLVENIISTNYIKDFSAFQVKEEQKNLLNRVYDSLTTENERLNQLCMIEVQEPLDIKRSLNSFYLFFSKNCNNKIYVEVVHSMAIYITGNTYEIYGRADTYLFDIANEKIEQIYKGYIAYN